MTRLLKLFLVPVLVLIAGVASAHEYTVGSLFVGHPFARASAGPAKVGAAYLTIRNDGGEPDQLIAVSTSRAEQVQMHTMDMANGVMVMRELPHGLTVKPGDTVKLEPGGIHLMLMGLKGPLKEGEKFPLTLTLRSRSMSRAWPQGPITRT